MTLEQAVKKLNELEKAEKENEAEKTSENTTDN